MTAADPELVVGALIAGKYRIEHILGKGGMGAVYLATNEDLGRRVAIKVLLRQFAQDEGLLRRFRQEARTAAAIGHPGIVDVLDLGSTEDGSPFIVMEALDGETLGARITRERRLDCDDTIDIVAQALDALVAAHDKGVLHRDLKPDNLFLVARPVPGVKLLDFGISKLAGADDIALTQSGMVFGTAYYMAPEQARGAKHAGPPSDVYSMGAILFHALAGYPPFLGDTYNAVLEKVFTETAPPITAFRADVPPHVAALIARMLDKDPAMRPGSAREAHDELLGAVPPPSMPEPAPAPGRATAETPTVPVASPHAVTLATGAPVKRSRGAWLGAGAVLVAGAIVAILFALPGKEQPVATAPMPRDAAAVRPVDAAPAPPVALKLVANVVARWSGPGVDCGTADRCVVTAPVGAHATVTATAAGYRPAELPLDFDADRTIAVQLEPIPARDAGVAAPHRVDAAIPKAAPVDALNVDEHNPLRP